MKKHIGLICGGESSEHEVSLLSASNIITHIDRDKYHLHCIGINKNGQWYLFSSDNIFLNSADPKKICLNLESAKKIIPKPFRSSFPLFDTETSRELDIPIDVWFPMVHGQNCEDGTLQGLLELTHIPFIGSKTTASALCFDKAMTKKILLSKNISITPFQVLDRRWKFWNNAIKQEKFESIVSKFALPLFVKPSTSGSSVGVNKVKDYHQFSNAVQQAFLYSETVLIEKAILGQEIEVSVFGPMNNLQRHSTFHHLSKYADEETQTYVTSIPGEIKTHHEFYSYEAKYIDSNGAELILPANVSDSDTARIRNIALQTYQELQCCGMARVDFFFETKTGKIFVNEVNTLPGFTQISMYPKMIMHSGVSYQELIELLIESSLVS